MCPANHAFPRISIYATAIALLTTFAAAPTASAGSVCVICSAPERTYTCSGPAELDRLPAKLARRAIGFVCATEIAEVHGHRSCRVRADDGRACFGDTFAVSDAAALRAASRHGSTAITNPAGSSPKQNQQTHPPTDSAAGIANNDETAKAPEGPPKTVLELAERTSRATSQQLQDATRSIGETGKAVTDTVTDTGKAVAKGVSDVAERTWTCLTSLFQRCLEDDRSAKQPDTQQ